MPRERLRLKITLERFRPAIWRRIEVDDGLSFWDLHRVIQVAMGWDDAHLHEFRVAGLRIRLPGDWDSMFDDELSALPEETTKLGMWLSGQRKFRYWYDFGDDWWHSIAIEKRLPADPAAPRAVLLAGKGACPPEDCGGVYGYADIIATLSDPAAEDYESVSEWLGDDFDPNVFDFAAHARRVAAIGQKPGPRRPTVAK
jgi:hypothetical protein